MLKLRPSFNLRRFFKTFTVLLIAAVFGMQATVGALPKRSFEALRMQHPWYDQEACGADGGGVATGMSPGPIFVLGDSIGEGVTGPLGTSLPSSEGWSVSGDSRQGRPLSEGIMIAQSAPAGLKSAKGVLVILGTNNLNNATNAADIDSLVAAIKAANSGATIFWLKINTSLPDLEAGEASFNAALGTADGITLIDNTVPLGDGIHPASYPDLANTIATQIKSSVSSGGAGATAPTGSAAQLAQQMLASPNISYWTNNGVNTRDVVVALSQGKKAYTTAANAANKEVDINVNILKFILEVAQSHKIMVNALTDKNHSNNSNHYKGLAVDLDNNGSNSPPTSVLDPIAQKYGGKRNNETTHWHYDFTEAPDQQASEGLATTGTCCPAGGAGSAANAALSANIPQVWRDLIAQTAPTYPNVNPNLVAATLWIENRGWPEYRTSGWGVSGAGAAGPWQFIAQTWASMGTDGDGDGRKDRDNPKDAVHAAFKHQLDSAGKPIAAEFDGNAESSFNKIVFQRDQQNLLSFLANYNGRGAPEGVKLSDFPRRENADYVIMGYWLLATDFAQTWLTGNWGVLTDAYIGPAAEGGSATGGAGASASGGCTSQEGGAVDGFPLVTTKTAIKEGADGGVWCFTSTENCHHDYNAADIHVAVGTKVVAAKPGRVVLSRESGGECGSSVAILGSDSNVYYYTHMKQGSIKVSDGQDITAGAEIGQVGEKACGTPPHLHFDAQPPPATNRPGCEGPECTDYTFIDVQPQLVPLYERLPE